MLSSIISRRSFNLAVFLACAGLLGYALYLQHYQGLEPCPLCIFQRVAYAALGLVALLAALHNPGDTGSRVYGSLMGLSALAGAAIAGRHVYLQHLPPGEAPACGPGLDYMMEVFPFAETLEMVLTGSGECAKVSWHFLGLSMPEWSLLCFGILGFWAITRNWAADIR